MAGNTDVLHISLLGQFRLRWGETAVLHLDTPSHQALLAYLVLYANKNHSRQHLAFTFWPNSTEAQARTNLRKAIYYLRHILPQVDQFLYADRYVLMWPGSMAYLLDVNEFIKASYQAQRATTPTEQRHFLETAIISYHGDLLPGHYEEWTLAYRETLRQQYLDCLTQHIHLLEKANEYAAAANSARRLLQADPLCETAYRRLMRLQALCGDRTGALRTYQSCTAALERELHILPSRPTEAAYRRLLGSEIMSNARLEACWPLVGRAQAWSILQAAWQRAVRERPLLVLIRGEAGIGKTHLAEELLDWAARQAVPILRSAGHAPTHSLPYAAVANLIRGTAVYEPLHEMDDAHLREIGRLLPELLSQRPDLIRPCPLGQTWQQERFFSALTYPVLRLPQPFLLFIDDLQWCDEATLEWLCFLLHCDPQAHFLLLGTTRDDEIGHAHPLGRLCSDLQHNDRFIQIDPSRLTPLETTTLASHVTGCTLSSAQADRLFTETEGVPLFVVEMAGQIVGFERSAMTSDLCQVDGLPAKVRSLLDERLVSLSPTARAVVELAATIGRSFGFDLLAAAGTLPPPALVLALDELCRRRILLEAGVDTYSFSHEKLRQVVCAAMSRTRRQWLRSQVQAAFVQQHVSAPLTF